MVRIKKKNKGLTLVELMAVIAISSVLGALVLTLCVSLSKNFSIAQKENIFQDKARVIYSHIEDNISGAKFVEVNPAYSGGQVTINGDVYTLPSVAVRPVITFTYKKNGDVMSCAYVYDDTNKEIYKSEIAEALPINSLNKVTSEFTEVKDFKVEELRNSDGTIDSKRYKVTLEFEDSRGRTDKYESIVVTRN
ncbi:MAG: prepilin-type N-terminal cleavage/methylation domain-containing protein [Clostridium sp.]